ncbi:unnamed protein product [Chironomus riparius]|uniref:Cytochrome c oxidase assembly factor 3 n=1 Tax=Chironomus riparius TaxID=315576 RepID=A0A9N9RLL5_9DIPT|nr:unnamed protein product [Chironomus riparius]
MSEIPKVKHLDRKLKQSEVDFMKLIEEQNIQRVLKLKKTRKNNILTAVALGVSVLGIYGYSMYAVKQEKFLDDFEEPAKEELTQKQL